MSEYLIGDPRKTLDNALKEREEMSKELLPLLDNLSGFLGQNGIYGSIGGGVGVDTRLQPPIYPSAFLHIYFIQREGRLYLEEEVELDGWELLRERKAYLYKVIEEIKGHHKHAVEIISKEPVEIHYRDGVYYMDGKPVGDPDHGVFL